MKTWEEKMQEAEEAFYEQYGDTEPYLHVEERRYVSESDIHPAERY